MPNPSRRQMHELMDYSVNHHPVLALARVEPDRPPSEVTGSAGPGVSQQGP